MFSGMALILDEGIKALYSAWNFIDEVNIGRVNRKGEPNT